MSSLVISWHSTINIFNLLSVFTSMTLSTHSLKILKVNWMNSFRLFLPNELTLLRWTLPHYHVLVNLPTLISDISFVFSWHHVLICLHLFRQNMSCQIGRFYYFFKRFYLFERGVVGSRVTSRLVPGPWDHDLSWSQKLNQPSQPPRHPTHKKKWRF